ncbi:MAG TPA: hypothetical protein VG890_10800 [Puia sp.]|nr:hypothetical protein [Puia sp.]
MEDHLLQQLFFTHIRNNLPQHISLVDEISALLNISNDSAYRRIRGEKEISFDEIRNLCAHFKISLDQLFYLNSESVVFSARLADHTNFNFEQYLKSVLEQLKFMNSFDRRELFYLNKDIPIFHQFHYHDLAAFKVFFWMKTLMQYPELSRSSFSIEDFPETLQNISNKIVDEYNKIPSVEIWNIESIHSTIRQIEYYKQTAVFKSAKDILALYDALDKTIIHIEQQAEAGYKFPLHSKQQGPKTPYRIYVNEFILGDNTLCAVLNDTKVAYVNHAVINYTFTKDTAFSEYTYKHFQNIIRKSTLISDTGEKERTRFFNSMHEKIEKRKQAAEHYTA